MSYDEVAMLAHGVVVDLVLDTKQFVSGGGLANVTLPDLVDHLFIGMSVLDLDEKQRRAYTCITGVVGNPNFHNRPTRSENEHLILVAIIELVFSNIIWVAGRIIQHSKVDLGDMECLKSCTLVII